MVKNLIIKNLIYFAIGIILGIFINCSTLSSWIAVDLAIFIFICILIIDNIKWKINYPKDDQKKDKLGILIYNDKEIEYETGDSLGQMKIIVPYDKIFEDEEELINRLLLINGTRYKIVSIDKIDLLKKKIVVSIKNI